MRILVVHRQEKIAAQIKSVVQPHNCFVSHCSSGLNGLFTSRLETYDLIICEINLPVVSGIELVRSIRLASPNMNTNVVFLAEESNENLVKLSESLNVKYLLNIQELERLLRGLLSSQESEVNTST
jgi:DNA-binding response OmpR family regulator